MNCENIKEKLSLYIDNLLDPDEAGIIKKHIESCDSCREYYNHLLKLGEMVDDFEISEKEEYWESQKDEVMEKIERAESEKIIKVQSAKKRGSYYKYLAVAASIALVGFVSIYESQEFNQLSGLFDDSEVPTAPISVEDSSKRGGRDEPISDAAEWKSNSGSRQLYTAPASVQKESVVKSQDIKEKKEIEGITESPPAKPIIAEPKPVESSLELGEPTDVLFDGELQSAIKPASVSLQTVDVKPLSFQRPKTDAEIDKVLSDETMQTKAVERLRKNGLEDRAAMSIESDADKYYMAELSVEKDSILTEKNIYRIRLDSLEKKYEGIYSPHYIESSAKGRVDIPPDSLNRAILALAETCFQVGILSNNENEREDMIEKLRRLSFNGNPESIEKIQRYIVLLLSAD